MDNGAVNNMTQNKKRSSVGLFALQIYIFMSYMAQNVILPSRLCTVALYTFIVCQGFILLYGRFVNLTDYGYPLWYTGFMLIGLLSFVYSPEKKIIGGTYYQLIVNLVLLTLICSLHIDHYILKRIMWTYVVSSLCLDVALIVTGEFSNVNERFGAELFGNQNVFAGMIMVATIYSIWLYLQDYNSLIKKMILLCSCILNYISLFFSGGKKYIIVPILFAYIILITKKDKAERTHFIRSTLFVALLIVGVYSAIMNIPQFYQLIGSRIEAMINFMLGNGQSYDASDIIRSRMISGGLRLWKSSPLWGYGFDSFKYYNVQLTGHFYYAHNNYVEMLFDLGLIGFFVYYSMYIRIGKALVLNRKKGAKHFGFALASLLSVMLYEYSAITYTETNIQIWVMLCYISITGIMEEEKGIV